ncbi:Ig-like domain-containing protein, partial [Paraburkholderia sp. UCT2]|uniref:Ig-like domain-containing protein n=1 Tax=Paraburkholderia sp. UCT2 TaxID=2615208 RepID=UPI00223BB7F5
PIQGPVDNGGSTDDTTPTLVGKGEPGDTIVVIDNGTPVGETEVDEDGNWSFTPDTPLDEGEHEFTVVERDPAGNESRPSEPHVVIIDTTVPALVLKAPEVPEMADGVIDAAEASDGTWVLIPAYTGMVEGDVITIDWNGKSYEHVVGAFDLLTGIKVKIPADDLIGQDTAFDISYTVTDAAGHVSSPSPTTHVRIYTMGPDKPEIDEVIDDVGLVQGPVGNGESTDDTTPTLVGKGEPGDTIVVIDNGTPVGETQVDEDGNWSFTPDTPLDEGEHEFTVVERDPAGNESKPSDPWTVIVDTTPPDAQATITSMGKDSGSSHSDFLTSDGSAGRSITGSLTAALAPGETVQVSVDGGKTWQDALVEDNGNWVFQDNTAHDASWTIQTRVVDEAGNCGDAVSQQVVLDTIAPAAPTSVSRSGSVVTVELPKSAAVGDIVNIAAGDYRFDHRLTAADIAAGKVSSTVDGNVDGSYGAAIVDQAGNISSYTVSTVPSVKIEEDFETSSSLTQFNGFTMVASRYSSTPYINYLGDRGIWLGTEGSDSTGDHTTSYNAVITLDSPASSVSYKLSSVNSSASYAVYLDAAGHEIGRTNFANSGPAQIYGYTVPSGGVPIASVKLFFVNEINGAILQDFAYQTVGGSDIPVDTAQQHVVSEGGYYGTNEDNLFAVGNVDVFDKAATHIDGNGGTDTLKLTGVDQTLDLTSLHGKLSSIEVFDITGTGNNTLRLSLGDVLDLGGKDLFVADGRTQVMVKGNAGDKVDLSDLLPDGGDVGNWMQQSGTTTVGGVAYDVFYHSGLNAELLVQHGVDTTLLNH